MSRSGQVVVEAGDQVLPGVGVELLRADLPLTAEFNKNLQRTHLETLRWRTTDCQPSTLTSPIPAGLLRSAESSS